MSRKYLITGGAGFIGAHIAKRLLGLGNEVIIVDNFNDYYNPKLKQQRVKGLLKNLKFKVYKTDISDFKELKAIFKQNKIDFICHQAAQAGVRHSLQNPFVYQQSNLKGTLNLLELAKDFKIQGFIFASSSSVYGNNKKIPFCENDIADSPISLYAATKKSTELLAYAYHDLYNIPMTGLRYFTVYGPWGRPDMAYFKFSDKIVNNKPIDIYGHGQMARDFTYIDDVVDGVIKVLKKNYAWQIFNLGYGSPVKLGRFIKLLEKNLGKKADKKYLSMQKGDVKITYADNTKAVEMLNWQPKVSIEEGIKKYVEWYKKCASKFRFTLF